MKYYILNKQEMSINEKTRFYIASILAIIDNLVGSQVELIIQNEQFQALHASWLGLHYLVNQRKNKGNIKIRMLNIDWKKLTANFMRSPEIENTLFFKLVYSQEYDMPGGKPYGLIIGDYYLNISDNKDITALKMIAEICAEAFVPFVTSVVPQSFCFDSYKNFDLAFNLELDLRHMLHKQWSWLRQQENARFLVLTLPRVLMDSYYNKLFKCTNNFAQIENIWGHPAYALAAVIANCYLDTNWFLDMLGVVTDDETNTLTGGCIPNLSASYFSTDQRPLIAKCLTEVWITESLERVLETYGFATIQHCIHANFAVFNSVTTVKQIDRIMNDEQNLNYALTASLQYMLCVCRFAHFIKIIGRDKIGSHYTARQCEDYLQSWITDYVASNLDVTPALKAQYPLRAAKVSVRYYDIEKTKLQCVVELCPHLRTTQMLASVVLKTNLLVDLNKT